MPPFPTCKPQAKQALQQAINDRGIPMKVNSAYRTIAQQLLLYNDRSNNSNPVAPPGTSNHQTGLAIDIEDPRGWESYLIRYGWNPLSNDPPPLQLRGWRHDRHSQQIDFGIPTALEIKTTRPTRLAKMEGLDRRPKPP